eukprot:scaffold4492_cov17-Tisochrysis_lutea.AAC.1
MIRKRSHRASSEMVILDWKCKKYQAVDVPQALTEIGNSDDCLQKYIEIRSNKRKLGRLRALQVAAPVEEKTYWLKEPC